MAEIDRVGVDDAPSGMPRFLEEQRARLVSALTPAPPRQQEPPPENPMVGFAKRLFGDSVSAAPRISAPSADYAQTLRNAGRGAADLSGIPKFLSDPLARREAYRETPVSGLLEFGESLFPPAFAQRQRTIDPETGQPLEDPTIAPIIPGAVAIGALSRGGKAVEKAAQGALGKAVVKRSAEQVAAEIGETTLKQATNAEYLARAASERTPGVLRTAEDMIRVGNIGETSVAAQRAIQDAASKDLAVNALRLTNSQTAALERNIASLAGEGTTATQRTQDQVFREIGSNLTKLEVDEPVKELILANAARNYDEIAQMSFTDQRRGVVTIAEQMRTAVQNIVPDIDLKQMLDTPKGTAFNAETLLATQQALISKGNDVLATAGRLAENATDADKARFILEMTELNSLQRVFAGGRSEAGRALRALREVVDDPLLKPRSVFERASEFIGGKEKSNKLVDGLVKIWTAPGLTPEARDRAVFGFLRTLDKPGALDFILEIRRNALLSGPHTLAVNAIGNLGVLTAERLLTRPVQAVWEAAFAAAGKRPGGREVYFNQVLRPLAGMTVGAARGFKDAKAVLRGELSAEQMSKFIETGQFYGKGEAVAGVLGGSGAAKAASTVINAPTRALAATDAVFFATAFDGELYSQAIRIASREGAKDISARAASLVANPTVEMLKAAKEYAKLVTLKSDPSPIAKAILDLRRSSNPLTKTAANVMVPFVQAPDNLIKLAFSYSPFGFIDAAIGSSAKVGGAARTAALSRASVGSSAMYFLILQNLQNGTIDLTGTLPSDKAERDAFYEAGKVPYSIRIGDGPYIQFSRLEPFATPIKWVAAARDVYEKEGKVLSPEVGAQMVWAGARAMLDATYLTGFTDMIEAANDPGNTGEKVTQWLARTGTGFIPFSSLMRTVAYAGDPFYRDPEDALQRIESQIPGLSERVRPIIGVSGQPAPRPESKRGLLGIVNPVLVSEPRQNAVLDGLNALSRPETIGPNGEKIPGEKFLLTFPAEQIRGLGLTKSEAFRLDQIAQNLSMTKLDALFATDEFKYAVPDRQRYLAEQAINDARGTARGIVADEILSEATKSSDPAMISRAAVMKIGTLQSDSSTGGPKTLNGNIQTFVRDLDRRGLLSPQAKKDIDDRRRGVNTDGTPAPTVDEMLKVAPFVEQYLALPPYGSKARPYGNPKEWEAVAEARRKMNEYLKENPAPQGRAGWTWYWRVDPEGASLIRRYDIVGPSRERQQLLRTHPDIERYLTTTKAY